MSPTVTSKGQVTIPKSIRDRLGLKPGSKVVFSMDEKGRAVLQAEAAPKVSRVDRFQKLRGSAPTVLSTDEIMALTRGEGSSLDPGSLAFAEEARRQSLLANASPDAAEDQAFVNAISWLSTSDTPQASDID